MLYQTVIFFLLIINRQVFSQKINPCKTPKDLNGDCKLLEKCESLKKLLTQIPVSTKDITLVRNSTCGFQGISPKVCCPLGLDFRNKENDTIIDKGIALPANLSVKLLPTVDECGFYNPNRFIGGDHPDLYEFPWMALIVYNSTRDFPDGTICDGVLISKRYVLSAAGCLELNKIISYVRLGEFNTTTDPDCVDYGFGAECSLPVVNVGVDKTDVYRDVGIVRLAKDVIFTDFVQPICLPMMQQQIERNYVGKELSISGWRKLDVLFMSEVKLKERILIKNSSDCSPSVPVQITDNHICGDMGKSSCSVGPMMALEVKKATRWYLVGLSQFSGQKCRVEVYIRISKILPQIISRFIKP